MSRYSDVNQLLNEIGTDDRSAGDPWRISRGSQGMVKGNPFSPSVEVDLGGPPQNLTSEMQSAQQIAKADAVVTSPSGSSANATGKSTTGSSILGGFLSLFPLPSLVGKLFGLGGSSSPAPLTPYVQPPSVNFEGAMSVPSSAGASGGVSNLTYGANGLPRSADGLSQAGGSLTHAALQAPVNAHAQTQGVASDLSGIMSQFAPEPAATSLARQGGISQAGNASPGVMGQLGSLTATNFMSEPASDSPLSGPQFLASSMQGSGASASSASQTGTPTNGAGPATSTMSSQSGQSILVQVQAMDSQSFMDHSSDIAQAVRQAMLNSHSVNDVIADL